MNIRVGEIEKLADFHVVRVEIAEYPEGHDELLGATNIANDRGIFDSWVTMPAIEAIESSEGASGETYTETVRHAERLTFKLPLSGGKYGYRILNDKGVVRFRFNFRKGDSLSGEHMDFVTFDRRMPKD